MYKIAFIIPYFANGGDAKLFPFMVENSRVEFGY